MKKSLVLYCAVLTLVLTAGAAFAADSDSIQGRVGVTGRIGFLVPSDSELFQNPSTLHSDVGFIGGGGFIYGIDKHFAVELDITNTDFDANLDGFRAGDFNTTNVSIGAQYRFVDVPVQHLVPYVGAGLDILFNDFNAADGSHLDVDTVPGVHVSAGTDYFLMKQLALTAELKGIVAPDADINFGGAKVGNYDPTSLSMTFGVRYFFN